MSQSQRDLRAAEKAARELHQARQQAKADEKNRILQRKLDDLQSILDVALRGELPIEKIIAYAAQVPDTPLSPLRPPTKEDYISQIPRASFLERHFGIGRKRRQAVIDQLRKRYQQAVENYKMERRRQETLSHFRAKLAIGDVNAVIAYFAAVLKHSHFPEAFPKLKTRLGFKQETGELIVEYDLPPFDSIMPTVKEYRYAKARDVIEERPFAKTDDRFLAELYEDVIAGITLRTLHELLTADVANVLKLIVFNGMVNTIDKATGQNIRPCLVSVQTTKEEFQRLKLSRVDKKACLKYLRAQTSPSSKEMVPVKPLVELITTDPRFVDEVNVLRHLDTRPNLLEMTPQQFEHLIANLFSEMGFKTGTTQISRDGGVDVIAFDERPIVGGKIIIQAKRYRNTVGVEAVRALYGVMQDEGATKGIMVCTSTFGVASRKFVKDKPIELIDGYGLLHYLREHGHDAKIEIHQS